MCEWVSKTNELILPSLNCLNLCLVSVISGEADRLSELQAIEKELEELQPKEHQEQRQSSNISNFLYKHLIRPLEVVEGAV